MFFGPYPDPHPQIYADPDRADMRTRADPDPKHCYFHEYFNQQQMSKINNSTWNLCFCPGLVDRVPAQPLHRENTEQDALLGQQSYQGQY